MSRLLYGSNWIAWALAAAMLAPFAATATAVWLLSNGPAQTMAAWTLALSDFILVASMGWLRIMRARRRGRISPRRTAMAALPTVCTLMGCVLIPAIGFHWAFVLLMGALAGQGLWDFGGSTMPRMLMYIRPVVTVGALTALLAGFVAF